MAQLDQNASLTGGRFRLTAGLAFRSWLVWAAIVAGGVLVRLWGVLDAPVEMFSDFRSHRIAALELMAGGIDYYMLQKGPGLAPWLALGFFVTGGTEYVHWLLWNTLFLFPLTLLAVWLAARAAIGDRPMALAAPLLIAVMPDYVHIARLTAAENVVLMAVGFSLWAILRACRDERYRWAAIGGLVFGLGLLVKPLFSMAAPLICAAFFLRLRPDFPFLHTDLGRRWRNLWRGVVFAAAALATIAPWSVYASLELGKPTPVAAYGGLAFFVSNQPYGDALYGIGQRRIDELIPEYDLAAARRLDYDQHVDYGLRYLTHHPASLLRDLRHNVLAAFGYSGMIANWVHRYTEGRASPYVTLRLEQATFFAILGLGFLGFVSAGGMRSGTAGATVRLICLYGLGFMPLVVLLGDERHRMAFMPAVALLAAAYLSAAADRQWQVWKPPAEGLGRACGTLRRVAVELWRGPQRHPLSTGAAIAATAALCFALSDHETLRLRPHDTVGGTAVVFETGLVADPNPVLGLPTDDDRPAFEAAFEVAAAGGAHRVAVVYSAAQAMPLDLHVNGRRVLNGILGETFGGAYNAFARERAVGTVALEPGLNRLTLRSADPSRPVLPEVLHRFRFPDQGAIAEQVGPAGGAFDARMTAGGALVIERAGLSVERFYIRLPPATLPEPLRAGESYSLDVPHKAEGSLRLKAWLLGRDAAGDEIQDHKFRQLLTPMISVLRFRPGRDLRRVELVLELDGRGVIEIGPDIVLAEGALVPGWRHVGPYIEEIRLTPVESGGG